MIQALPYRFDVSEAVRQIDAQPDVWNRYRDRLDRYGSPHSGVDDIWVRFNAPENMGAGPEAFFQGEHESAWYPVVHQLPAVWSLVRSLYRRVGGKRLGGVLITRIPPGGEVKPHIDTGWHAGFYEKFAIQIKGTPEQAFCFEGTQLSALPGESYTFDNSKLHWVTNDSDTDRMTLIVCIKRDAPMLKPDERVPFDMYFASIASMQAHPGAGTKEHKKMTLQECRDMALEMLAIRRNLIEEN